MEKIDKALSYFLNNFNCSQAVIAAYAEELGMNPEEALKVSCAFGGGMGALGKTCGAVTGALMVIGLKYGKFKPEDTTSKQKTYELTKEFIKRFVEKNDTTECKTLLDEDLSTTQGYQNAKEKGLFENLCPNFVKDAIEILEEIL